MLKGASRVRTLVAVAAVAVAVLLVLWPLLKTDGPPNDTSITDRDQPTNRPEGDEQLRTLLAQRRQQFGDKHPETRRTMNDLAKSLSDQGKLASARKEFPAAKMYFEQSLALYREAENYREVGGKLFDLAVVAKRQEDTASARKLFSESLANFRKAGDALNAKVVVRALNDLAE